MRRKLYRNPVHQGGVRENRQRSEEDYKEEIQVRQVESREQTAIRRKFVPESGTSGRIRNRQRSEESCCRKSGTSGRDPGNGQRSEESCAGIRYAERNWEQVATRRKLSQNQVRQSRLREQDRNTEESCTGIRYAERNWQQEVTKKKVVPGIRYVR